MKKRALIAGLLAAPALCATAAAPPTETNSLVERGRSRYAQDCAVCHGVHAKGDGPMAKVLVVPPPDLTGLAQRNDGTFPTDYARRVIDGRELPLSHGDIDMPVWGSQYKRALPGYGEERVQQRLDALIEYLRTLQVVPDKPLP